MRESKGGVGRCAVSREYHPIQGGQVQASAPVTSLAPVRREADRASSTKFANVSTFGLRFKNESKLRDLFSPSRWL